MFDFKDSAQKFCKGFGGVSSIQCHITLSMKDNDKFNTLKITLWLFCWNSVYQTQLPWFYILWVAVSNVWNISCCKVATMNDANEILLHY